MTTIGEKIKKLRQERNWTQDYLGEKIGRHGRHVSRYENNKTRPSIKTLGKMAEVFGVSVDELTYDEGKILHEGMIHDKELLRQFQEIEKASEEDRYIAKKMLQALLMKQQLQHLLAQQA